MCCRWEVRENWSFLLFSFTLGAFFFFLWQKKKLVLCGWSCHNLCRIHRFEIENSRWLKSLERERDQTLDDNSFGKSQRALIFLSSENGSQYLIVVFALIFSHDVKKKKKNRGKKQQHHQKIGAPWKRKEKRRRELEQARSQTKTTMQFCTSSW